MVLVFIKVVIFSILFSIRNKKESVGQVYKFFSAELQKKYNSVVKNAWETFAFNLSSN